jgi:phosphoglycolate phosphatase
MQAPVIAFDLDGTLVDTAPDLIDTLNLVFEREGLPPVPYATARNLIGGGARAMIVRGLEAEGRNVSKTELDALVADFLAHYGEHLADKSRPFPGLVEALDELTAQGFRLAVCTNKLERLASGLLDALELSNRFAAICGQDTFGIQKPDPQILLRTISAAGGDAKRAVMIGDSEMDVRTARAAGMPIVAVDFGYSDPPVVKFAPDRLIAHFAELTRAVSELLPAK